MEIIKGKIPGAKKVVVYGPEGIGKSTFAACFPSPLFIDTEGSTKDMEVARTPAPSSWIMLLEQIAYVKANPDICRTLVVDTIDWAEQMCVEHVCALHQKTGIEDFGYGNGYVYAKEEFGRFLNKLNEIVLTGIHVVLTAHAQIRKFEQPNEMGAYDRWELKLGKKTTSQTSPLVKEWADMVLFANYKTYSVAVDDKGKKHKAQGGARVMYTSHHPCWDAKNRYGFPEEMPFAYTGIAHVIGEAPGTGGKTQQERVQESSPAVSEPEKREEPVPEKSRKQELPAQETNAVPDIPDNIPEALKDLMRKNAVSEWDIQAVVAAKGYFPSDVPVERYNSLKPGFVEGVLIGAWPKVYESIKSMKETMEIPFN